MIKRLLPFIAAAFVALPVVSASASSVAAWGENTHSELDAGYKNAFEAFPVPSVGLPAVKEVVAAGGASYALLPDGSIRSWGGDVYGQCGCGQRTSAITKPVPVKGVTTATQVSGAAAHAIALLSNGTVVVWGSNLFGQLGNGTSTKGIEAPGDYSAVPLAVKGITNAVAVVAGGADDFVLLANGQLIAWGANVQGQLGDGTTVEKTVPTEVKAVSGVKQVAVGGLGVKGGHTLALMNNGTVVGWGANGQGQLGNGTTTNTLTAVPVKNLTNVSTITTEVAHSAAVLTDGSVQTWGNNSYGELGAATSQKCGKTLEPCSTVPVTVPNVNKVSQLVTGFRYNAAISGGNVFTWGWNRAGELGDGTRVDKAVPTQVSIAGATAVAAGEYHTLAMLTGAAPPPTISFTVGSKALTVSWLSNETTEAWRISYRPVTKPVSPWGAFVKLPIETRSYTVTGLTPGQPYNILVQNKIFGAKVVTGTPGA